MSKPTQESGTSAQHVDIEVSPEGGKPESMTPSMIRSGRYEIIVQDKKGFFASAIPERLPCCVAILLCFLNCVVPGLGTMLSAPFSLCEGKDTKTRLRNFGVNLLAGFLQLILTAAVLIGWLWSILWAIEYLKPLKGDDFKET